MKSKFQKNKQERSDLIPDSKCPVTSTKWPYTRFKNKGHVTRLTVSVDCCETYKFKGRPRKMSSGGTKLFSRK